MIHLADGDHFIVELVAGKEGHGTIVARHRVEVEHFGIHNGIGCVFLRWNLDSEAEPYTLDIVVDVHPGQILTYKRVL